METTQWHDFSFGNGSFLWVDESDEGRLIIDKTQQAYVYEPFPHRCFSLLQQANYAKDDSVARGIWSAGIATWSPITTSDAEMHEAASEITERIEHRLYNPTMNQSTAPTVGSLATYTARFYAVEKDAVRMSGQLLGAAQDFVHNKRNAFAGALAFTLDEVVGWEQTEASAHAVHTFEADYTDAMKTYESLTELDEPTVDAVEALTDSLVPLPTVRRSPSQ